ncbi:thiol-specific monooxygenase [Diplocarpon mali]|nr:thiol-specific monooxygenase [Diplocarpon mali]
MGTAVPLETPAFYDLKGDAFRGHKVPRRCQMLSNLQHHYALTHHHLSNILDIEAMERSVVKTRKNATTVAVVGAGVSGLCAAKYLLAERAEKFPNEEYFKVTVFEQADQAGGIWNQTAADDKFATPMYPACKTNVPRTMMQYEGINYPARTPLFPRNTVVKKYLQDYARELEDRNIIQYNSEVTLVKYRTKDYNKKWQVNVKNPTTGRVEETHWDAVVVALGTFGRPDIPPMYKLNEDSPITIMHSKMYRDAEVFRGKRVLIVGGGPSYWDTAQEISAVCEGEVLVSVRRPGVLRLSSGNQRQVPEVIYVSAESNTVLFRSGRTAQVDVIFLCTGYTYHFDMIPCLETTDDKKRVLNLYEHMIYINEDEDPTAPPAGETKALKAGRGANTLALVGLLTMDATFLVAEAQSALIARYFSGRWSLSVPAMQEARALDHDRAEASGRAGSRDYHILRYPHDAAYVDRLFGACLRAELPAGMGTGLTPSFHSAQLHWVRGQIGRIRTRFLERARGPDDGRYPTPESLGFAYRAHPARAAQEDVMRELWGLMREKRGLWEQGADLQAWQCGWVAAMGRWQAWQAQEAELASMLKSIEL